MKLQAPSSNAPVAQLSALGEWLAVELAGLGMAVWRRRRGVCWRIQDRLVSGRREFCHAGDVRWLDGWVYRGLQDQGIPPFGVFGGRNAVSGWVADVEFGKKTSPRRHRGTEKTS